MNRQELTDAWQLKNNETFAGFERAVRARAAELGTGTIQGKARSLYTQLSRWRDGSNNFEKRGDADVLKQAIADVLEVDVVSLFGPDVPEDEALFPMTGFEAIGPFDPRTESPCVESPLLVVSSRALTPFDDEPGRRLNWLRPPERGAIWVHAPSGSGRSFVSHWHRHRWKTWPWDPNDLGRRPPAVFVVDRIEDLAGVDWPPELQPMVVEVQRDGGDLRLLDRLLGHGAMVIAPFACPEPEDIKRSPVWRVSSWVKVEWAPDSHWRRAFIAWAEERVRRRFADDTLLDGESVARWLDGVDPHCRFLDTPEALLGILQYAHHKGERELKKHFGAPLAREWLAELLGRHPGENARDVWLRESGAATLREMVLAWWWEPQISWNDHVDASSWERVVPDEAVGAVDAGREEALRIRARLKRKVSKGERKELEARLDELLRLLPHKAEVVRALVAARLLRPRGAAELQLSPGWVAVALVRTELAEAITRGPVEPWGRASIDLLRQAEVDTALDRLDWESMTRVIGRALDAPTPGAIAVVGAIESLFLAVGRKLRDGATIPARTAPVLDALARRQLQLLVRRSQDGVPAPRTRGGLHEPAQGGARFIAACWDWSFARPVLEEFTGESSAWLFPGWAPPAMERLPHALSFHDGRGATGPLASAERDGAARLAALAPEVLARCAGEFVEGPWGLPSFVVAAAAALAHRKGWSFPAVVQALWKTPTAHDLAAHWICELPADERATTIDLIWEALLTEATPSEDLLRAFSDREGPGVYAETVLRRANPIPPLDALLHSRLPMDRLVARIAADARWTQERITRLLVRAPEGTRVTLARPLLALCNEAGASAAIGLGHAALAFPDEMFEVLVEVASDRHVAHEVVAALWNRRPDFVRERAEAAWREHGATEPWIAYMPPQRLGSVLEVFEAVPERPLNPILLQWLSRTLPSAGPLAERIWALLEREQWSGLR